MNDITFVCHKRKYPKLSKCPTLNVLFSRNYHTESIISYKFQNQPNKFLRDLLSCKKPYKYVFYIFAIFFDSVGLSIFFNLICSILIKLNIVDFIHFSCLVLLKVRQFEFKLY